ncbi:cytochrome P450 [Agrocybe pediades]|nr:cytochrome P450 [Agrocybe pediades]
MEALVPLSQNEALFAVVGSAIAVHIFFKKHETYEPILVLPLTVGLPLALTTFCIPYAASYVQAALIVVPLFWTALLTSIVTYRLSPWHPLARYPGPILCRLSQFHLAFISLKGKQHIYFKKLHEQYGDVVRVGPNELSFCDANAVGPILGNTGLPKGAFWDGRIPEAEVVKPLIAIRDKTEHTRRRRPWTRAFTTVALKGYEELVTKRVNQLVDSLLAQQNPVDLATWISYFAYDVMSDLAFGGGSEMMAEGDKSGLWHLLESGQRSAIFMGHVPWLGRLFLRYPQFAGDLKAFRAHARTRALLRKQQTSPHKDIFHHLMDEDGVATTPPTTAEVTSDGSLAIIAGSDTTSSAIAHLCYFLMAHPTAYKRLQEEVDEMGDNLYDATTQARMPYLNAAINEALRLLPPILNGSQRKLEVGSGGRMIGSHFLPEDNSAFVPTYTIQRDPRNFSPLSDSFLPERWLPAEQREALEPKIFSNPNDYIHNLTAFLPFSVGPENCAGKNLAYLEMRMAMCTIISRLDMKFADGYDPKDWFVDMMDFFVTKKGVLPTNITPRKSSKAL